MHKKDEALIFLIIGSILDYIFGPKKDKLFCPVFVFYKSMSNAICHLVLYLETEDLNISWIYSGTTPFEYLKTVLAMHYSILWPTGSQFIFFKCNRYIWDLGVKFREKRIHLFWAFWILSFKFSFKRRNHEENP